MARRVPFRVRALRRAQAQETAPSIRQDGAKCGIRPSCGRDWLGRARPCCTAARRTDPDRPACRPTGAARCTGRTRPSVIDHIPLPVRDRPLAPRGTHPCSRTGLPRRDGHALLGPRVCQNQFGFWKQPSIAVCRTAQTETYERHCGRVPKSNSRIFISSFPARSARGVLLTQQEYLFPADRYTEYPTYANWSVNPTQLKWSLITTYL